jgi:hypothetical protein
MVVAHRVVCHVTTVVLLVEGREEDVVKPGLEVTVKELAALLLLVVQPWEEDIDQDVLEAD